MKILRGGGATADAAAVPEPEPVVEGVEGKKVAPAVGTDPDPASGEADDSVAVSSTARVATDSEPATVAKHVTSIQKMSDVIFPGGFQATLDDKTVKLAFKNDTKKNEFKAILSNVLRATQLNVAINAMLRQLPEGGFLEIGGVKIAKDTAGNVAVGLLQKVFLEST